MKKKLMFALVGAVPALASFAEGEANGTTQAVTTLLTESQTALNGLVTAALPIVSDIVIAGLTIWGGFKLFGLLRKAFSFGTTR